MNAKDTIARELIFVATLCKFDGHAQTPVAPMHVVGLVDGEMECNVGNAA